MGQRYRLDVSHLECPEPLEGILEHLDRLKTGQFLHVLHRRSPDLLYPLLKKRGFHYLIRTEENSSWEILIWRQGDDVARTAAQAFPATSGTDE